MRQHFSQIVSRDFPDSRPTVELIFKQLSFIRKPLLFWALMLLPMTGWGATYNLIEGGKINTTDFWTQGTLSSGSMSDTYDKCVKLSGNVTSITSLASSKNYIAYDVKTTSTSVKVILYNSNKSPKDFYISEVKEVLLKDGKATSKMQTESVASKKKDTELTFSTTNTGASTLYFHSAAASNAEIYQIIITESGDPLPNIVGGAIGYSVNLKYGRLACKAAEVSVFNGISYCVSSDFKPTNNGELKLKTFGTHYISFTLSEKTQVEVTTTSSVKFTFGSAKNVAGTTEFGGSSATHKAVLAAGTYYLNPIDGNSSDLKLTKLAFAEPPATYTVTYSAGEGSGTVPTQDPLEKDKTFKVAQPTGLTAPAGQEFKCWNDGTNDYNPGATYTMGTSNVTLTAQWTAKTDKYTVKYMDGTTHMGTETVEVGSHPTASEITTTKAHYQFESWQKNGEDIALSSVSGTKDQTITLTARYTALYSTSFNFGTTTDLTKDNIKSKLEAKNYTCSVGTGGEYDSGGTTGYLGYKFKNNGDWVEFLLKQGDIATVTYGYTQSGWNVNGASAGVATGQKAYVDKVYYATDGDKIYKLENLSANGKTSVLTKIIIETPAPKYTVTYSLNEGTGTIPTQADQEEGAKFNLALKGDIAKEGFDFVGWDDGTDTLTAGSEYTMPGQAVTFSAAWAVHVTNYTVTFKDGETTMGTEQVRENEYATAAGISTAKAGFIFQNWCSDKELTTAVTLSSAAIVKDTTFYAKYEKAYALSVDFKAAASGSKSVGDFLNENYYTISSLSDVSWDTNSGADKGLKIKKTGRNITFDVKGGKLVVFSPGHISGATFEGVALSTSETKYGYSATDKKYTYATTTDSYNILQKITITDPYVVTLNATTGGGSVDPASMTFTGTALTLPAATHDTKTFEGWYADSQFETKIALTEGKFIPSCDTTLYAKFLDKLDKTNLESLKYGTDEASATAIEVKEGVTTYTVVLPYAKEITAYPTVFAKVPAAEKSTLGEITQATAETKKATFTVTAEDGTTKANYVINFTNGPKDPICIVKTVATGTKTQTLSGLYADMTATDMVNLKSDKKLSNEYSYIGVQLVSAQKFKEGDIINVHTTAAAQQGNIAIYHNTGEQAVKIADLSTGFGGLGDNKFALPKAVEDYSTLFICRTTSNMFNACIDFVEVTRAMNPVLTKATLCDKVATISESDKTVTVEVPFSTDITAVTPAFEYVSNDNSKVVITPAGAQDFSAAKTYRFTDKDGDYTEYEVSITKAAASDDATLKSLSVTGYTLDPAFAAETLEYTIERAYKDKDAELPAISYEVNYSAATAVKTTEGKVVTITVTAEDGTTQKAYTITFTNKAASTDATLKSLMYGDKAITLVADQYTYNVNLPYGTTDVPALTAVKNDELASDPVINNATAFVDFQATSTATVTAESGAQQVYTVNFTVAEFPSVVIFDGSTMTAMATSPDASGLSWAEVGTTMSQADKSATYQDVSYTKSLQLGTTSATKHFTITVPENKMAKIHLLIMTNSSGSTRSAWITTSADKGNKEDAIMSVSSSSYTDLGDGTTDWLADNTTYYIHTDNTVNFFVISVELKPIAPKCEVPAISAQPESNTQFGAGNLTASVTASVTDGGTLSYQWYNASDDSEVSGATAATLTTTTEGSYYVIITNTLADHRDNFVKSETAQLGYRTLNDATLSALGYGETAITLVDAQYEYAVELAKGTTEVPALTATTSSSYATKVITNAPAFVNYKATSTVVVTAEDGTTQLTYTVNFTVKHDVEQQDVTGNMTWDFTNSGAVDAQVNGENDGTYRVLANYDGVKSTFKGQYMAADFNKITTGSMQAKGIKIHTTTPGLITIEFSNTGKKDNNRVLYINGEATTAKSKNTTHVTYSQMMPAGDILLQGFEETATWNLLNYYKITFTQATRLDRSDLTAGKVTGVCLENNVTHFLGAKFYYISHKAQDESSIVLAEVDNLKAGYPYIMIAEGKDVYYAQGTETADEALNYNGLYGTFENKELGDGYCIFLNNKYYRTHDGNNNGCYAHRAYLKLSEVSTDPVTIAPGESAPQVSPRFFILGGEGRGMVTGFDTVGETDLGEPRKFIIHNQVVIIRNGQMFNAQGALIR